MLILTLGGSSGAWTLANESGQLLGAVGDTALSEVAEEPHLHFEMEIDDVSVNPLDYISKESQEASFTFDDTVYEG